MGLANTPCCLGTSRHPVTSYVLFRLAQLVVVLVVVSFLTFGLVHLLPGNPTTAILGPGASAHARLALEHQLGLNKPMPVAYLDWLLHAAQGNLGQSYITHQSVASAIRQALPVDIELLVISQVMALAIAVPLALAAARRPGGLFDQSASTVSFAMLAVPAFVAAVILQQVLAVHLGAFPATGWVGLTSSPLQNLRDAFLPSLTIAVGSIAAYMRLLRADLVSTLQQEYITMARSKGLSTSRIMLRHAFRPSTFSLMTVAGLSIGAVISGAFVVEYLFALPGMGEQAITAIYQRDYLLLQGDVLVFTSLFVVANFAVDLAYTFIDPRVRLGR